MSSIKPNHSQLEHITVSEMLARFCRVYFAVLYLGILSICPTLDRAALREKAVAIWASLGAAPSTMPADETAPAPYATAINEAPSDTASVVDSSESETDYAELPMLSDGVEWATAATRVSALGFADEYTSWRYKPADGSDKRMLKAAIALLGHKPTPILRTSMGGHLAASSTGSIPSLVSSASSGPSTETISASSAPMFRSSTRRSWFSLSLIRKSSSLPRLPLPEGTKRGPLNSQSYIPTPPRKDFSTRTLQPPTLPTEQVPFLPANHPAMLALHERHQHVQMARWALAAAEREVRRAEVLAKTARGERVSQAERRATREGRRGSMRAHGTVERAVGAVDVRREEEAAREKARVWGEEVRAAAAVEQGEGVLKVRLGSAQAGSLFVPPGEGEGPQSVMVSRAELRQEAQTVKARWWARAGTQKQKTEAQLEREALEKEHRGVGAWY